MIKQTPWFERKFNFTFDAGLFPVIYHRLEGSIIRLHHMFEMASDAKAKIKTNRWSAKEHLGHLYDMEELWWKRWEDFKNNREEMTIADLSNTKTYEAHHNETPVAELLRNFSTERKKILEAIYDCDEEILLRTSLHPRLKTPMRMVDYFYFVAEHDDHHICAAAILMDDRKLQ
jgi:uncharacterized damage-inducible protein DinB